MPGAASVAEIADAFNMTSVRQKNWHVQGIIFLHSLCEKVEDFF